jgi:glycosyltransferase involved in cell wall biosynthesis
MKIAVTVDPELPVPPPLYGGIERIVDMLVRGLTERGHDVLLFANAESQVPCLLEPYPGCRSGSSLDTLRNMGLITRRVLGRDVDLVHSFGRLAYLLPLLPLSVPKIMSYQRAISPRSVQLGSRLSHGTLHFVGCSRSLIAPWAGRPNWHVVYNAAPLAAYTFVPEVPADAPLMFLGRIEEIKGPHIAIQVARSTGQRLILAGNVPDDHRSFFDEQIGPYIDDDLIRYVGPVDDAQKNELLGRSKALLMPILWDEPFGIVMAEALACGTPVIGFARGSVPEVVDDGLTGFVVDSIETMAARSLGLEQISRVACRESMEAQFSDSALVDGYLSLYEHVLAGREERAT